MNAVQVKKKEIRNMFRRQYLQAYFHSIRESFLTEMPCNQISSQDQTINISSILEAFPESIEQLNRSKLPPLLIQQVIGNQSLWLHKCKQIDNLCLWVNIMQFITKLILHSKSQQTRVQLIEFTFRSICLQSQQLINRHKTQKNLIMNIIMIFLSIFNRQICHLVNDQGQKLRLINLINMGLNVKIQSNICLLTKTLYFVNCLLQNKSINQKHLQKLNILKLISIAQFVMDRMFQPDQQQLKFIKICLILFIQMSNSSDYLRMFEAEVFNQLFQQTFQHPFNINHEIVSLTVILCSNLTLLKTQKQTNINGIHILLDYAYKSNDLQLVKNVQQYKSIIDRFK